MLRTYSRAFRTVEVDATFYGLPPEQAVTSWRDGVPNGFVFALKVPQQITHEGRFSNRDGLLRQFLDRASLLDHKLGPLLLQMAAGFKPTEESRAVLRDFLNSLPGDFRWALEFRRAEWLTPDVLDLLRSRNVAVALVESRWIRRAAMLDLALEPTADFAYLRWTGSAGAKTGGRTSWANRSQVLSVWAVAVQEMLGMVGTVFGYFGKRFTGSGPHSMTDFQHMICEKTGEPQTLRC